MKHMNIVQNHEIELVQNYILNIVQNHNIKSFCWGQTKLNVQRKQFIVISHTWKAIWFAVPCCTHFHKLICNKFLTVPNIGKNVCGWTHMSTLGSLRR